MRFRKIQFSALGLILVTGGCASAVKQVVPEPTNITFENAVLSVVKALRGGEMESRRSGSSSLGLNACTVEVDFDITAGGQDKSSLVLDASIKGGNAVVNGGGEVKSETDRMLEASRGNHIKMLLTSVSCIPATTLAGTKPASVGQIAREEEGIRKAGRTQFDEPSKR